MTVTSTLLFIFFSLCGAGILVSLAAPSLRPGSVLALAGSLAATALVLAGGDALVGGDTFRQPLWSLPGLTTLTLALDRLSAVFILVTGLILFPASIFAGGELRRESSQQYARVFTVQLLGLFASIVFALSGAGLALTAALAVTCFVKVFAMSFLGIRRLDKNQPVTEAKIATLVPMAVLAALCLAFGVLPTYVIPVLGSALNPLAGEGAADALVPPFFVSSPSHNTLPAASLVRFSRWSLKKIGRARYIISF